MKTTHLLLPIMHVAYFDDDLDDSGNPFAHVFITADWRIKMTTEEWERYQYDPKKDEPETPREVRLTIEERLRMISQSLHNSEEPDPVDQYERYMQAGNQSLNEKEGQRQVDNLLPPQPVVGVDDRGVVVVMTEDEKEQQAKNRDFDLQMRDLEDTIGGLDLSTDPAEKMRIAGVLIGDDAGPDGQDLAPENWTKACQFIMRPLPKGLSDGEKHRIMVGKNAMFNRISGAPFYKLLNLMEITPKPIRTRIAALNVSKLGENSNFIPGTWAGYIQGDTESDMKMVQAFGSAVAWKDPRPPQVQFPEKDLNTIGNARTGSDQTNMGSLGLAWDAVQSQAGFSPGELD